MDLSSNIQDIQRGRQLHYRAIPLRPLGRILAFAATRVQVNDLTDYEFSSQAGIGSFKAISRKTWIKAAKRANFSRFCANCRVGQ